MYDALWCKFCDRHFVNEHALGQHKDNTKRHPRCDTCDRNFTTAFGLRMHYARHSAHQKLYCDRCSLYFESSRTKANHVNTSDRHNRCPSCRLDFSRPEKLRDHWLTVEHGGTYCQACDTEFNNVNGFRQVMLLGSCQWSTPTDQEAAFPSPPSKNHTMLRLSGCSVCHTFSHASPPRRRCMLQGEAQRRQYTCTKISTKSMVRAHCPGSVRMPWLFSIVPILEFLDSAYRIAPVQREDHQRICRGHSWVFRGPACWLVIVAKSSIYNCPREWGGFLTFMCSKADLASLQEWLLTTLPKIEV